MPWCADRPGTGESCTWSIHATAVCRAMRRGRARQRLDPTRVCQASPGGHSSAAGGRNPRFVGGQAVPDPSARQGRQSWVGYPQKVLVRRAPLKSGWFPAESFQQMR